MPEAAAAASTVDGAAAGAAANAGTWAESLDADTKTWVGGMGLDKLPPDQALAKVLPMYRGAEQKLGVPADQLLRLPGKDAKPEDWKAVYSKLGAPEKPEDYGLQAPEGDAGEFLKTATGWFHELGVPKTMAAGLAGKWGEYVQAQQEVAVGKWNQRFDAEVAELKGAWGQDYDKHLDLSNRVLKAAGFTPEQQKALEQALGPKAFRMAFAKFGSMVGEHKFVGGEGGQGFGMSPESAKARIAALQADKDWQAKYLAGDADKKAEWTRLHEIAHGTQPTGFAA
jgi:hypothetical protein